MSFCQISINTFKPNTNALEFRQTSWQRPAEGKYTLYVSLVNLLTSVSSKQPVEQGSNIWLHKEYQKCNIILLWCLISVECYSINWKYFFSISFRYHRRGVKYIDPRLKCTLLLDLPNYQILMLPCDTQDQQNLVML